MRETIDEIFDAIEGAGDVNQKLAMLGSVLEALMVNEVMPEHRAQAVENFCGIVRRRVGVALN